MKYIFALLCSTLIGSTLVAIPTTVYAHIAVNPENVASAPAPAPCEVGSVINCAATDDLTLEDVVKDLLAGHAVSTVSDLPCEEIVDHDFEHVGEALMTYMHPDEEEHERIDTMMGGEGSESLRSMHVFMGKRFLGCDAYAYGPMMMNFTGDQWGNPYQRSSYAGMMGWPSMMMGGFFQPNVYGSMMGSGWYWGFGVMNLAIWVLAILGVVWVIQKLTMKK